MSQPPHCSVEANSSTSGGGEVPKPTGSRGKKSSCTKYSPPTKVCQETCDKDSSASKHQERFRKDKEDSKFLHKCTESLTQGATMHGEKEPHLERPSSLLHFITESPTQ